MFPLRCLLLACICATASPLSAFLTSAKAAGMGLIGISYPQDALAGALNPAGIADVPDRCDVNLFFSRETGHAVIHDNRTPPSLAPHVNGNFSPYITKDSIFPEFGINKRFYYCFDIACGFVVYNRNAIKTTYSKVFPLLGTSKLGLEYIHQTASPVVAMRYGAFSFGISLNYMVQRLKIEGVQNFDNPRFSAFPGHVTNNGYNYSKGISTTVGAKWDVSDWISVGVTYQPKTHMSRLKKYKGFLANKGRLDIPALISGGVTFRMPPHASISLDVQYVAWDKIPPLQHPLLPNLQESLLGTKNGAGFGWRSQTIFRLGVDWHVTPCVTVRAGFRWTDTLIPQTQTAVNLLTNETATDFVTFGISWIPFDRCEVSAFYAHSLHNEIHGYNSIPFSFGGGNVDLLQNKKIVGFGVGCLY